VDDPAPVPSEPDAPPVVIEARGVGKRFDIYRNDRDRLLEVFGRRRHHGEHWALRGVDFEVRRGRSFGVVGPNGAGKSTLLRLIAGISRPTEGVVRVAAPLSTLLDLGVGFHPHFTGRENIALHGSLVGMGREAMEDRLPRIVEFAELDAFIDYPLRTWSSGMVLRLGFGIAAFTDAPILLVDEVLAVGDQYFQRKCIRKIEEFTAEGRTIVLVSHDLHAVRSLCREVLWLDAGSVRALGPAREVVDRYLGAERVRVARARPAETGDAFPFAPTPDPSPPPVVRSTLDDPALHDALVAACAVPDAARRFAEAADTRPFDTYDGDRPVLIGSGEVRVLEVRLLDGAGRPRSAFRTGETLVVAVTFRTTMPIPRPVFGVALFRDDGTYVHGPNTRFDRVLDGTYHGIYTFFAVYPGLPLLAGSYRVSVAVFDEAHLKPHVWHNQLYEFEVAQDVEDHGLVHLEHAWGLIVHHEAPPASGA